LSFYFVGLIRAKSDPVRNNTTGKRITQHKIDGRKEKKFFSREYQGDAGKNFLRELPAFSPYIRQCHTLDRGPLRNSLYKSTQREQSMNAGPRRNCRRLRAAAKEPRKIFYLGWHGSGPKTLNAI
jgi:hypothetical protein